MALNLRATLSGRRNVMSTSRLPVLFLTDLVVLPGMVVPIELDDAARAAVDAAKAHSDGTLLVAPRLEDRYASYGVVAEIVQLGRLATGEPAAVIKAERRVRIGSGVSGPGTALWVEAEELPEPAHETEEVTKLAAEYKGLVRQCFQVSHVRVRRRRVVACSASQGPGRLPRPNDRTG